ncbi:MAG: hypothetical protein MUE69_12865 [Myxococcota bacterium]|nr:hypothetical protein [Myxococcota bacterium]
MTREILARHEGIALGEQGLEVVGLALAVAAAARVARARRFERAGIDERRIVVLHVVQPVAAQRARVARDVLAARTVAGLARYAELRDLRLEAPVRVEPRIRRDVVAKDAVVVPAGHVTFDVFDGGRKLLRIRGEECAVHGKETGLFDVPRDRKAPPGVVVAREVLLVAVRAHSTVDRPRAGLPVRTLGLDSVSVAFTRESKAPPEIVERSAVERTKHGALVRLLRHRAVERPVPARVVIFVTPPACVGADVVDLSEVDCRRQLFACFECEPAEDS